MICTLSMKCRKGRRLSEMRFNNYWEFLLSHWEEHKVLHFSVHHVSGFLKWGVLRVSSAININFPVYVLGSQQTLSLNAMVTLYGCWVNLNLADTLTFRHVKKKKKSLVATFYPWESFMTLRPAELLCLCEAFICSLGCSMECILFEEPLSWLKTCQASTHKQKDRHKWVNYVTLIYLKCNYALTWICIFYDHVLNSQFKVILILFMGIK